MLRRTLLFAEARYVLLDTLDRYPRRSPDVDDIEIAGCDEFVGSGPADSQQEGGLADRQQERSRAGCTRRAGIRTTHHATAGWRAWVDLIERPECKRRWLAPSWDQQVAIAVRGWMLDRLEESRYWPAPSALATVSRIAAEARSDAEFVEAARIYVDREDVDVAELVAGLVQAEAVPYLAAFRYTESGMRKYAQALKTWDLQRRQDAGEAIDSIPVPAKFAKADFAGSAWDHRGKLDVPKERFISYPGAERETDPSMVIGRAGWDHLARARALATWYLQAKREGRDEEYLTPLLAGLAELVLWLKQWYDEPNPDPALDRPGSQIAALVDAEMRALHLTPDDLTAWRPPAPSRGRGRRARA